MGLHRGACPALLPAYPAFSLFFCPLSPRPPSPPGKGETKVISCKGLRPLHPRGLNPRFAAKLTEFLYLEQCRQPRRGGTGGDGTIRRTRRRRLRWSSPPEQIEQVPRGLAFFVARRPHLSLAFLPLSPRPPSQREGETLGYFMQGAAPLASPGLNPGGTGSTCHCRRLNGGRAPGVAGSVSVSGARRGLAFFAACLPCLQFIFLPPIPPAPFPGGEGGDFRLFHARGFAPCIPGAEPGRHWSRGAYHALAGVCLRNRQLAVKPIEQPFYWQCRQPRRGGTGGEELRRLRWSSPPGQVEQMPHGERSPAPPSGGTGAGAYRALEERLAPTFFFPCLDRRGGL